jgi:predicted lipid-binding transport protein (Tim44 family)
MAFRRRPLILILAATLALGFAGDAFARAGGGFSFGSRGARTFGAPSATPLAPSVAPMERSMTSPNDSIFRRPAPASEGGFFSGGFGRGLLGGFIGAGLFGLLFGHGMFGGLGGGLSILGLLLQVGLLFLLFKFIMGFVRGRRPAFQGAALNSNAGQGLGQAGSGAAGGFAGLGGGPANPRRETRLEVGPADFGVFEQRLAAIQSAFGVEDFDSLRAQATPEMASYFAEELAGNAKKGLVNKIADVKFLQGVSEAWRESQGEYATVALRFSLIDTMVDRISGKIVSGDPTVPQQATEVWTFARHIGGSADDWKLSAIQQA